MRTIAAVLPDILARDLVVIFVGTAKSTASVRAGHYYANPQNMFWNFLEATGLAGDVWIGPSRDQTVLEHGVGLTDLVPARAASSDAILKASDCDVPGFLKKIKRYEPAVVAFNGEPAAGKVARYLKQPTPVEGPAAWPMRRGACLPVAILVQRQCERRLRRKARQVGRVWQLG